MKRLTFVLALSLFALVLFGAGTPPAAANSCSDLCYDVYFDCASGICGPVPRAECYQYYQTCLGCCSRYGFACAAC
jgi:hypothetical protein